MWWWILVLIAGWAALTWASKAEPSIWRLDGDWVSEFYDHLILLTIGGFLFALLILLLTWLLF